MSFESKLVFYQFAPAYKAFVDRTSDSQSIGCVKQKEVFSCFFSLSVFHNRRLNTAFGTFSILKFVYECSASENINESRVRALQDKQTTRSHLILSRLCEISKG
jgi:hypothetical protein